MRLGRFGDRQVQGETVQVQGLGVQGGEFKFKEVGIKDEWFL
jgi:hypothetical protein